MILKVLPVGMLEANCYLVGCKDTKECIVIDPGDEAERILEVIEQEGLKPVYIVNTHGPMDHISADFKLKQATSAKLMIHQADAEMLRNPRTSLASWLGREFQGVSPDILLSDGDNITFGSGCQIEVIHTPGHTPGGVCLKIGNFLFSGDTLFAGSIGRTDLPGGSYRELLTSIKEKLLSLPDETIVYPGHGPDTTIGQEKRHNPFLS